MLASISSTLASSKAKSNTLPFPVYTSLCKKDTLIQIHESNCGVFRAAAHRILSALQNNWRTLMCPLSTISYTLRKMLITSSTQSLVCRIHTGRNTRRSDQSIGFSFSGEVREPFPAVIQALQETKVPVTSVDAPSSWDIEQGPPKSGLGSSFMPTALVSLSAPKPLVKHFTGRHFVGGR